MKIRVSIGSLGVLGLRKIKLPAPPTTLYLMVGEKCAYNCAYCPQSRSSHGSTSYLSRVIWPKTDWEEVKNAVSNAPKMVKRVCFQVVNSPHFLENTLFFVKEIKGVSNLPVSVSVRLSSAKELGALFESGTQRVGLALDVASEKTFSEYRGGNFSETVNFIAKAGENFPNRITTHIIVGMGETDRELYEVMRKFYESTVTVGLFAFTPIKGTRLEGKKPPSLKRYRRAQVVRSFFASGKRFEPEFDEKGNLIAIKTSDADEFVKNPRIFVTNGCPNCNRPYYNEEPLGPMFNYPFPPKSTERLVKEFVKDASSEKIVFDI